MLMIWPKESNLDDLLKEKLEEGEVWEKGETYMLKLIVREDDETQTIGSLQNRLKIWKFKGNWDEEKLIADNFYKNCMNAYNQIQSNKFFLQVIGYTLGIGNVLNGGTPKGQADGFDLPVLGKLNSMKDNSNQTLLQFICKKICE